MAKKNKLTVTIGDQDFPIRRVGISYHMMKFAEAQEAASKKEPHKTKKEMGPCQCARCVKVREQRDEAGLKLLLALKRALFVMVPEDYHDELDEYLETVALDPGQLEEAISTAMGKVSSDATENDDEDEPEDEEGKGEE